MSEVTLTPAAEALPIATKAWVDSCILGINQSAIAGQFVYRLWLGGQEPLAALEAAIGTERVLDKSSLNEQGAGELRVILEAK